MTHRRKLMVHFKSTLFSMLQLKYCKFKQKKTCFWVNNWKHAQKYKSRFSTKRSQVLHKTCVRFTLSQRRAWNDSFVILDCTWATSLEFDHLRQILKLILNQKCHNTSRPCWPVTCYILLPIQKRKGRVYVFCRFKCEHLAQENHKI